MNTLTRTACACAYALFLCLVPAAHADELSVGDPAPPLTLSSWIKGEPIEGFKEGRVYVVEFWATWCGPCIQAMPHLSELQRRYKDEVAVLGVNILERQPERVPAWMEERGDALMDYAVAMQEGTKMAESWMEAAGERGIPASFIVGRDGKIAWIGHPGRLDGPLERVVAGTWDLRAAREARDAKRAADREREAVRRRFESRASEALAAFSSARSAEEAVPAAERILAMDPPEDLAMDCFDQAFFRSSFELQDAGRALALARSHRDLLLKQPAGSLKRYAAVMLTSGAFDEVRDYGLIVELLERAHTLDADDAEVMVMCARAHMERAIELQREAVKHAKEPERETLERTLASYETARTTEE